MSRFLFLKAFLFFSVLIFLMPVFGQKETSFKDWQKQRKSEFGAYKSKVDAQFGKFLKQRWKEFNLYRGIKPYEDPKPEKLPEVLNPLKSIPNQTPIVEPEKPTIPTSPKKAIIDKPLKAEPEIPDDKAAALPARNQKEIQVNYFDRAVVFTISPSLLDLNLKGKLSDREIARNWEKLGSSEYEPFIEQLKNIKATLRLNDWGYGNLVQKTSEQIYSKDPNAGRILIWFVMIKSGYDVRLGYSDKDLFLFASAREDVYGTPYIRINHKKYYNTNFEGKNPPKVRFKSYGKDYPGDLKPIELKFKQPPLLGKSTNVNKNLKFDYRNKTYSVSIKYDKNYIRFVNSFPDSSFEVFLSSPMNPEAGRELKNFISKSVKGLSQVEAVNFVLAFVQKAFKYKTDKDQFGFEKYFFPDELVFYDYSDCEDRVALFSYLVREVLNLEVIALHYPNHLAAAVHFNGKVDGDQISYKRKTYLVSDPTYINASVGQAMPQFKKVAPKIISF